MAETIDTREVAKQLIESGDNFFKELEKNSLSVKSLFFGFFKDIKKIMNSFPDKEEFKKILANYLDLRVPFNNPLVEMVDYMAFKKALDAIDSIISRWNKDWYDDLKKLFEKIDDKVEDKPADPAPAEPVAPVPVDTDITAEPGKDEIK